MMRLLVAVMVLIFVACKDDELYGINSNTKSYLLANKKWQTSAIYVKSPQGLVIRDEYVLLPEFRKDDYYLFRADSTFELNDNVSRDPIATSPVLASGNWNLIKSEQFLKLETTYNPYFQDSIKIASLTESSLTVEKPVIDGVQFISFRVIP